jgi:DNA modification methylase
MSVELMHGDCLEMMQLIPDGSVDMVLADPPYGTTACKWDTVIPLEAMWAELKRIIKPNGAIVMTASQPFTSALVMSNPRAFKYAAVWDKANAASGLHAKIQPLKNHEDVIVFGYGRLNYIPQMESAKPRTDRARAIPNGEAFSGKIAERGYSNGGLKYPKTIWRFSNASQRGKVHPTQKPVALVEYLIKTYTNEGETVLDFACGSGTTGVACVNTGRKFIGIELDQGYFDIATQRINQSLEANL